MSGVTGRLMQESKITVNFKSALLLLLIYVISMHQVPWLFKIAKDVDIYLINYPACNKLRFPPPPYSLDELQDIGLMSINILLNKILLIADLNINP